MMKFGFKEGRAVLGLQNMLRYAKNPPQFRRLPGQLATGPDLLGPVAHLDVNSRRLAGVEAAELDADRAGAHHSLLAIAVSSQCHSS